MHATLPAPLHSEHEGLHAMQTAPGATYVPTLGHSATQLPPWRKSAGSQLRQSVSPPPLHVAHDALHDSHSIEPLGANRPAGVHEARQRFAAKNGFVEAQVVHSLSEGPKQVSHESWHAHAQAKAPTSVHQNFLLPHVKRGFSRRGGRE